MGARAIVFSAASAAYLIVACATGGIGELGDGGGPVDMPDTAMDVDADTGSPPGDGQSFDTGSNMDSGGMPPMDSAPPPDTATPDSYIPPTDSAPPPVDAGIPDTPPPPMDVVVTTPTCPLLNIKYALEDSILGDSAVPCSLGCGPKECCWHGTSPPVCLAK